MACITKLKALVSFHASLVSGLKLKWLYTDIPSLHPILYCSVHEYDKCVMNRLSYISGRVSSRGKHHVKCSCNMVNKKNFQ